MVVDLGAEVVGKLFNNILESIINALFALQEQTLKRALVIDDPTKVSGLGEGFTRNMELFPYLLIIAAFVAIGSLPLANRKVRIEDFLLNLIKVFAFVALIGPGLSLGVQLSNVLIRFALEPAGSNSMAFDMGATIAGFSGSLVLVIFGVVIGATSWFTFTFLLLAIYLREYIVLFTYYTAPIIAPTLVLSYGPLVSVQRLPRWVLSLTSIMLVSGVLLAFSVSAGAAAGGALGDFATADGEINEEIEGNGEYIEFTNSAWSVTDPLSKNDIGQNVLPGTLSRSVRLCRMAMDNFGLDGVDGDVVPDSDSTAYSIADRYGSGGSDFYDGEGVNSGPPTEDNIVEACIAPVASTGLDPVEEGVDHIVHVSPFPVDKAAEKCNVEPPGQGEVQEFYENNQDCIREAEESEVGVDYDKWRVIERGIQYQWSNKVDEKERTLGGPGAPLAKAVDWLTGGNGNDGYGYYGDGSGETCTGVTGTTYKCFPSTTAVDGFNQFMFVLLSLIGPLFLLIYVGRMAGGGMRGMGAKGSGQSSGSSSAGAEQGGTYEPIEGGTETLSNPDPIDVEDSGPSHHHNNPMMETSVDQPGDASYVSSPDAIQPDTDPTLNSDKIKAGASGGASRLVAGFKEAKRQGIHGGPGTWAKSAYGHMKENPVGNPPNSTPDTNEDILDDVDSFDELPDANPAETQHREMEAGTATNLNGTYTFYEQEDSGYSQAGVLYTVDSEGKSHAVPWATNNESLSLRDGGTYDIDGVVVQDAQESIGGFSGNANAVEPGVQSNVKPVDEDIGSISGGQDEVQSQAGSGNTGPGSDDTDSKASTSDSSDARQGATTTSQEVKSNAEAAQRNSSKAEQSAESRAEEDVANETPPDVGDEEVSKNAGDGFLPDWVRNEDG
jgi:hypothetical protein